MCRVEKKIGWPCREIAFGRHIALDKKLAVNGRDRARKRTDDICSCLTLITLACQHSPLAVATSSGEVRLKKQVMDLWCAKKNRFNYMKQFYKVVYLLLIHQVLQQKKSHFWVNEVTDYSWKGFHQKPPVNRVGSSEFGPVDSPAVQRKWNRMMEIRDNTHWIIMPKSQPSVHNILPDLHVLASIRPDQIPKSRQSAALSLGAALIHRASLHYWTGGRVAIWTPLCSQKKKQKNLKLNLVFYVLFLTPSL